MFIKKYSDKTFFQHDNSCQADLFLMCVSVLLELEFENFTEDFSQKRSQQINLHCYQNVNIIVIVHMDTNIADFSVCYVSRKHIRQENLLCFHENIADCPTNYSRQEN